MGRCVISRTGALKSPQFFFRGQLLWSCYAYNSLFAANRFEMGDIQEPPAAKRARVPSAPTPARTVRLSVEAFGSGTVLHRQLEFPSERTVQEMVEHIRDLQPPQVRSIRLFLGHGGPEVGNWTGPICGTALSRQADVPLVLFRTICTLLLACMAWCLRRIVLIMN